MFPKQCVLNILYCSVNRIILILDGIFDTIRYTDIICIYWRGLAQSCPTLCDPVEGSLPGSAIHGIFQQEYWSGLPFPSPGQLPPQGLNLGLLHCRQTQALSF